MTTDNFKHIIPLLKFNSDDDFYFIQIMKRRKENPEMKTGVSVIREYFVGSIDYLTKKKPMMIELAEKHNARITIRLNKRSYKKTAMKMMIDVAQKIENEHYKACRNSFSSVAGQYHNDSNKKWIIDVDQEDLDRYTEDDMKLHIYRCMDNSRPEGNKIIAKIPSATGYHLIVKPFDVREFKTKYPTLDIKKDNPTNLYIP